MDSEICKLYFHILRKQINLRDRSNVLLLKPLLLPGKVSIVRETDKFKDIHERCAYLYMYGTLLTHALSKLMQRLFFDIFFTDLQILPLWGQEINICCVGGWCGADAVAIIKTISRSYNMLPTNTHESITFRITVVDSNIEWKSMFLDVMDQLQSNYNYWKPTRIFMNFEFIEADLLLPTSPEVLHAVRTADVLTMVKFMSTLRAVTKLKKQRMMSEIFENMKMDAIFLFVDSSGDTYFSQVAQAADKFPSLQLIHGPNFNEFVSLSLLAVEKHLELHKLKFGSQLCATDCTVSAAVWKKSTLKVQIPVEPMASFNCEEVANETATKESKGKATKTALKVQIPAEPTASVICEEVANESATKESKGKKALKVQIPAEPSASFNCEEVSNEIAAKLSKRKMKKTAGNSKSSCNTLKPKRREHYPMSVHHKNCCVTVCK